MYKNLMAPVNNFSPSLLHLQATQRSEQWILSHLPIKIRR